jgi:hypothetical protein
MASTQTIASPPPPAPAATALLVSIASTPQDALSRLLENLTAAFPNETLVVASPDASIDLQNPRVIGYAPATRSRLEWTNTAADYLNDFELLKTYPARALLQLGAGAETLAPTALRDLATAVLASGVDLAVPRYTLPPRAGLVNSAILYPLSRALFGARPRFPLALDLCLSPRMVERLATAAQRFTAANQPDALVWPIAEASLGACVIAEFDVGSRTLPQPAATDLNALLAQVSGSLFADLDQKATFWQRARVAPPSRPLALQSPAQTPQEIQTEIQPMIDSFRLAYSNLREIWSLVLPPQSLLGLKHLSEMPTPSFRMADALWARIVYDFLLAFRLRTLNRGHLLGALTPLYLAWVASHILLTTESTDAERHVEAQAIAFEAEKPYLVSRWRWPDRFNP